MFAVWMARKASNDLPPLVFVIPIVDQQQLQPLVKKSLKSQSNHKMSTEEETKKEETKPEEGEAAPAEAEHHEESTAEFAPVVSIAVFTPTTVVVHR